jgi:hypothetical protein
MPTKTEIGENQKYLSKLIDIARCAERKAKDLQAKIDVDKSPAILYSQMKTRLMISATAKVVKDLNAVVGGLAAVEQDLAEIQELQGDQMLIGDANDKKKPARKKPGPKPGAKKKPGPKKGTSEKTAKVV